MIICKDEEDVMDKKRKNLQKIEQTDSSDLCVPKDDEVGIKEVYFTKQDFRIQGLLESVEPQIRVLKSFSEN